MCSDCAYDHGTSCGQGCGAPRTCDEGWECQGCGTCALRCACTQDMHARHLHVRTIPAPAHSTSGSTGPNQQSPACVGTSMCSDCAYDHGTSCGEGCGAPRTCDEGRECQGCGTGLSRACTCWLRERDIDHECERSQSVHLRHMHAHVRTNHAPARSGRASACSTHSRVCVAQLVWLQTPLALRRSCGLVRRCTAQQVPPLPNGHSASSSAGLKQHCPPAPAGTSMCSDCAENHGQTCAGSCGTRSCEAMTTCVECNDVLCNDCGDHHTC